MEALSTKKLQSIFDLQENILPKICFGKKTDNVNSLFAAYIVPTVYEMYVGEILKFVLKSDSGLYWNGRLFSLFMDEP